MISPRPAFMSRLLLRQVGSLRHAGQSVSRPPLPLSWKQQTTAQSRSIATARLRTRPGATTTSKRNVFPRQQSSSKRFYTSQTQSEKPSLSQRLKKLSREYGWSALGVYLLLSALDFPFCFAAVRLLGVERIGYYEHVVAEGAKKILRSVWPVASKSSPSSPEEGGDSSVKKDEAIKAADGHGVLEAERKNSGEGASTWRYLLVCFLFDFRKNILIRTLHKQAS
jgi:hypothetical protein